MHDFLLFLGWVLYGLGVYYLPIPFFRPFRWDWFLCVYLYSIFQTPILLLHNSLFMWELMYSYFLCSMAQNMTKSFICGLLGTGLLHWFVVFLFHLLLLIRPGMVLFGLQNQTRFNKIMLVNKLEFIYQPIFFFHLNHFIFFIL
uniref:NADH dehydrogenase subunit 6 n=1 Tax=Chenopodium album TaxID=3559 RepID=A0A291S841_CHEAL|nr:NADH dehydrogenase subunit 6 [Chenopodium album]